MVPAKERISGEGQGAGPLTPALSHGEPEDSVPQQALALTRRFSRYVHAVPGSTDRTSAIGTLV
jgi:hypothetical protein